MSDKACLAALERVDSLKSERDAAIKRAQAAEGERDALAAHASVLESIINGSSLTDSPHVMSALNSAPTTSLARRDLLKRAEGMADAARRLNNMSHPKAAAYFKGGAVRFLEYQADKLRSQAEADQ